MGLSGVKKLIFIAEFPLLALSSDFWMLFADKYSFLFFNLDSFLLFHFYVLLFCLLFGIFYWWLLWEITLHFFGRFGYFSSGFWLLAFCGYLWDYHLPSGFWVIVGLALDRLGSTCLRSGCEVVLFPWRGGLWLFLSSLWYSLFGSSLIMDLLFLTSFEDLDLINPFDFYLDFELSFLYFCPAYLTSSAVRL